MGSSRGSGEGWGQILKVELMGFAVDPSRGDSCAAGSVVQVRAAGSISQ